MQDIYELTIDDWNNFPKEKEVNYDAENGDIVLEISGVLFLLQRINDMNNVICLGFEN